MSLKNMKVPPLLIAHDAGGAEFICAWATNKFKQVFGYARGPALKVFRKWGIKCYPTLKDIPQKKIGWLLTSTSLRSTLEWKAIRFFKTKGILVVSFLDHWVNYNVRFFRYDQYIYPNYFWVGDKYAQKLAEDNFPSEKIRLVKNYYLVHSQHKIASLEKKSVQTHKKNRLLYLAEPIDTIRNGVKYNDFYILDNFLSFLVKSSQLHYQIKLKSHPRENEDKYKLLIDKYNYILSIEDTKNKSLEELVAWSNVVVGVQTMGMVVALYAGRVVLTSATVDYGRISLPFENILSYETYLQTHNNQLIASDD